MADLGKRGAEPRHARSRWSFLDRKLHGSRRPMRQFGFRGWVAVIGLEVAFVALAIQGLIHGRFVAAGWLVPAVAEAGIFAWYMRRPVAK